MKWVKWWHFAKVVLNWKSYVRGKRFVRILMSYKNAELGDIHPLTPKSPFIEDWIWEEQIIIRTAEKNTHPAYQIRSTISQK